MLVHDKSKVQHLEDYPVHVFEGDITDRSSLFEPRRDCTHIYHCAGAATDWSPWNTFYRANVVGVQHLLEVVQNNSKLERFLHVSTTDVYGYPKIPCDETHELIDVGSV